MADLLIEQMENMDDGLYFDEMYEEQRDAYYPPQSRRQVICKYCKTTPLKWRRIMGKWVLFGINGDLHTCGNYLPSIEILREIKRLKMDKEQLNKEQLLPIPSWDGRLSIEEYGCLLSLIGKGRSEDCFTHTSGVAISKDKRILGISYNGLAPGMIVPDWMKKEDNRAKKSEFYLHAEDNLFALIKKGECHLLCLNISPCISCCRTIIANNVTRVVYLKEYHRCNKFKEFFKFYGVDCHELSMESKKNIKLYLRNDFNFEELK